VFKCKFFELRSEFSHHLEIYKDGVRTAAAVVAPNSVKTVRLPDNASIFTAELHALDMALGIIRRTRNKDYVVYSDSLSSLQAIDSCKVENPLIFKILKDHSQLINSGKSITFCWIPSHVGIRGNENADTAAKAGLDVAISNMRFPVSDLLACVNQLWQHLWSQCTSNKLYSVQPVIGRNRDPSLSRYDSVQGRRKHFDIGPANPFLFPSLPFPPSYPLPSFPFVIVGPSFFPPLSLPSIFASLPLEVGALNLARGSAAEP